MFKELNKSFQTVNRFYLTEVNQTKLTKREVNQLNIWRAFLQNHCMEFPGAGQLIQILIATLQETRCMKMKLNSFDSCMSGNGD